MLDHPISRRLLLSMTGAAGLSACVPSDRPSQADRTNPRPSGVPGRWLLQSVDGQPLGRRSKLELVFDANGSLSGALDCNSLAGSWRVEDGNRLVFPPIATTLMGCLDVDGAAASAWMAAMSMPDADVRFTLDSDDMIMTTSGRRGVFKRQR